MTDSVIKAITGADKDSHFTDPFTNRRNISEVSGNGPVETVGNGENSLAIP
jgi:hypothetical protein